MNKSEFLIKINELEHSDNGWDNNSYAKESGFKECKQKVVQLAKNLDEGDFTIDSFKHYRDTLDLLNTRYKDLFDLQNQVFKLQQEKIMRNEIETQNLRMGKKSMINKVFPIFIAEFSELFLQLNSNKVEVKDGYDAIDLETITKLFDEFQKRMEQKKLDLLEELKNE